MSQVSSTSASPDRRSDARANRRALLEAAQEVFAEGGPEASMSSVARCAGVSRATLYRNFPDREALAFAVLEQNVEALEERAARLEGTEDAFVEMLRLVVDQQVKVQSLVPVLAASAENASVLEARLVKLFEEPVRSAQASGRLRSSFEASDILWLVDMLGAALRDDAPDQRQRQADRALSVVLDGLLAAP